MDSHISVSPIGDTALPLLVAERHSDDNDQELFHVSWSPLLTAERSSMLGLPFRIWRNRTDESVSLPNRADVMSPESLGAFPRLTSSFARNRSDPICVALPVYNESRRLGSSVALLHAFLSRSLDHFRIIIVDNGSTDRTPAIGLDLKRLRHVEYERLETKGRGFALREIWLKRAEPILAYMDIDLSTGLDCFIPLITPLLRGTHDISVGSRLLRGAHVRRGLKREIISRLYNLLLRMAFRFPVVDAQCGFKALTFSAAKDILPRVRNHNWFFDTELLLIGSVRGWRIHEEPVSWRDDEQSTVRILPTILEDLSGIIRMKRDLIMHQPPG